MSRHFAEFFAQLEPRTPTLFPIQSADSALSQEIMNADLFAGKSGEFVELCRVGLLLWNDDLDFSHPISQKMESQSGSFWHGIVHRREADFSNANYWWNRTGTHPTFDSICDLVLHAVPDFPFLHEIRDSGAWEPKAFTDFCRRARETGEWTSQLESVQRLEMRVLLEWCAAQVK
ncbi:hypothetical protein B1R32_10539 [Abditibacterium utsteinense]|uniref:Uncharacterized protein n=1 Tax=Abditibacterium utsteinense TaxID=1960156 RepID=A0A2S8SUA4_9BACT|nr:hypothetical protein [Abditibacterium utsteinense]PQV64358.1 hypothetical protein B1R32_10539 [Abditibacterium utsteinense]